jgi:hypothetical protein
MSAYTEALANEQRLLAEQARQKKILDDAAAQATLQAQLQQQVKNLQGQVSKYEDKISALEFGQLNEGCASLATLNKEVAKKVAQPEVWSECAALCKKIGELEYCEFYQQD